MMSPIPFWVSLGSLHKGGHRSTHTSERRLEFNPHNLPSLLLSRQGPACLLSRDQIQFLLCAMLNNMPTPWIIPYSTSFNMNSIKTNDIFWTRVILFFPRNKLWSVILPNLLILLLMNFIFDCFRISVCMCCSDAWWHSSTQPNSQFQFVHCPILYIFLCLDLYFFSYLDLDLIEWFAPLTRVATQVSRGWWED